MFPREESKQPAGGPEDAAASNLDNELMDQHVYGVSTRFIKGDSLI